MCSIDLCFSGLFQTSHSKWLKQMDRATPTCVEVVPFPPVFQSQLALPLMRRNSLHSVASLFISINVSDIWYLLWFAISSKFQDWNQWWHKHERHLWSWSSVIYKNQVFSFVCYVILVRLNIWKLSLWWWEILRKNSFKQ